MTKKHIAGLKRVGAKVISQATITAEPVMKVTYPSMLIPSIF